MDRQVDDEYRIAVVADTHVPDRNAGMNPHLLPMLAAQAPRFILHAGDITRAKVLHQLEKIAPVIAVKGNRDIFQLPYLPLIKSLHICQKQLVLLHGHAGLIPYLGDKIRLLLGRNDLAFFLPRLMRAGVAADVVVFGHTHYTVNQFYEGILLFNPGSPNVSDKEGGKLSFGVLHIKRGELPRGEIIELPRFS